MENELEALERIKKEWLETWDINEKAGGSIGVLWDTLKAVVRGLLMRENSILNKTNDLIKSNLEKTIVELEASFILNNDRKILLQIEAKKKELEDMDLQKVQKNLLYLKRDFFE